MLQPGGRLGVAAWTPTGAVGAMFRVLARHLPPPPAWVQAPLLWGDRGHARELFGPHGMKVEFTVDTVRFRYESAQEEIDRYWDALLQGGTPEQCGWLKDRYGVSWQIVPKVLSTLVADPDREKARRVTEAMLRMVKLDIAELERAAAAEARV